MEPFRMSTSHIRYGDCQAMVVVNLGIVSTQRSFLPVNTV